MNFSNKPNIEFDPYSDLNQDELAKIFIQVGEDNFYIEKSNTLFKNKPSFRTSKEDSKISRNITFNEFKMLEDILRKVSLDDVKFICGKKPEIANKTNTDKYQNMVSELPKLYKEFTDSEINFASNKGLDR